MSMIEIVIDVIKMMTKEDYTNVKRMIVKLDAEIDALALLEDTNSVAKRVLICMLDSIENLYNDLKDLRKCFKE